MTYIVSGGMKTIISASFEALKEEKKLKSDFSNIVLCASGEEFQNDGEFIKFRDPFVVSCNKDQSLTLEKYPELLNYKNAIVLGDAVEDFRISHKINSQIKVMLSIGFENENSEELYKKCDIVIKNDGNLTFVNDIIQYIKDGVFSDTLKEFMS